MASSSSDGLTPMMQQYRRVKSQIPADALLLFRLGDFYEMFFEDAKTAAGLLNLTLTARNGTPMCGLPHHAAEGYIGKLLKHGKKVAICDQIEEAKPGKLVQRDVTQILSPGTHFDAHILDAERNNFLAAICAVPVGAASPPLLPAWRFGFALIDLTTGDFKVTELASLEQLQNELTRVKPAEIIVPAEWFAEAQTIIAGAAPYEGWTFERETAFFTLRDHFKTQSLDGFGARDLTIGIGAAGAAIHYLQQALRRNTGHIHRLTVYSVGDYMVLDAVTQRNLELLEAARGDRRHTLIGCLDRTKTPMGARLLREWVTHPLRDVPGIVARQDVVAKFGDEAQWLAEFREQLAGVRDLERTLARLSVGSGTARDLVAVKESLGALPKLRQTLARVGATNVGATSASRPFLAEASGAYQAWPKPIRTPWGDFPEVISSADLRAAKLHPDYEAGKAGDADAAYRFVQATLTTTAVKRLRQLTGAREPILVAAHAVEAEGRRNAIPEAYAVVLSERLALAVDEQVVQTNVVQHTGAGAFHRLAFQPLFAGRIEPGREYLVLDDNVAVGGTLANLRGFIAAQGGRVLGATTLTESGPSGTVALRSDTLAALQTKHGVALNHYWHEEFGHGLDCLTESEARHLLKAPTVDEIRNRLVAARQAADSATGRGLDRGGEVREEALTEPVGLLEQYTAQITELPELVELIARAIEDAPPLLVREGGMIRTGFSPELDEFKCAMSDGKNWIAALQQREADRTGIASLKIRYTSVFGYFIEITKSHLAKVPDEYIRKQTVATGERYFTPELKEMENKILGAEDKAHALEYELFLGVRKAVIEKSAEIQRSAAAIAALDVLAGLAELARHQNYCRPVIDAGDKLEFVDGRHPVLEQTLIEERFVPNDTLLDGVANQVLIITGPNMAGKSTYIRQVALLTLMAQIGSFVPAKQATVGLVDRIFTRIGATDDLSRGQSTFLVEMNETANILNNATGKSLVILDEIGRGTSTFDGLSIAWSVAEHLHNTVGAKTLFATHYHELTEMAVTLPRVKNYNVAVREWHDQVIFLHKILPGGTDKSYGIQVARLAGLPKAVIQRAKEVLANLEEAEISADGKPKLAKSKKKSTVNETPQMFLFKK